MSTVIRGARVLLNGEERPACVHIEAGRVVEVSDRDVLLPDGARVVELADDEVLIPGLVDTHVHVNEPGRTEWEGFASATAAAALGGVTTLIDMPLNSIPPTTTVAGLRVKQEAADGQCYVNVGFWGGAVPGNLDDLHPLHEAGVFGFKCFLLHSGVDEFPPLDPQELQDAMTRIASFDGLTIVHAEDAATIAASVGVGGPAYADFLRSRPGVAENLAVQQVIDVATRTGARAHILHLSCAEAIPAIRAARQQGVRLTVETCPHYLSLVSEEIPSGATQFKCCPPIRERANQDELWQALTDGVIDFVVTDHSPSTADLKHFETGDFATAWGGVAGLQIGLPAVWTAARSRGIPLSRVVGWMSTNTANWAGLHGRGRIAPGVAADLVVLAPDQQFTVDVKQLRHKNPVSAYDHRALFGVVRSTWLAGEPIDLSDAPRGQLLNRP